MIIHKPQVAELASEIRVSARIEMTTPGIDVPDTLWFGVPLEYRDFVSDRADAFVVGLLPTAMSLVENIVVRGKVSPRLAWGIREYQALLHQWWRPEDYFSIVETEYDDLEEPPETMGAVGSTVSGGVDSFYTLWRHHPNNETIPGYRLTHGLIINGYDNDIDLDGTGKFKRTAATFEPLIERAGMKLLTPSNNLQAFRFAGRRRARLNISYEAPISASVLLLGKLFSRFYLPGPGSYGYGDLIPLGPNPISFPMFSTERLQIIADGHDATRAEKTTAITEWPETYTTLRVCWRPTEFDEKTGLFVNCCRCQKCVRTMLALDVLGALPKYKTFSLPLRRRDVWRIRWSPHLNVYNHDNANLARKMGRRDRVTDLRIAALRSRLRINL